MEPIDFAIIKNTVKTNDIQILKDLTNLKNLYSSQLVKMPRQYIVKLLFDTNHMSLLLKINGKISAGVTFRGFDTKPFYEIAFLAVSKQNQYSGLGSKVMNRFKNHCQSESIQHVFTYADNTATQFFEKHGFSKQLSVPEKEYKAYIKEYLGGQLMECKLNLGLKIDFQKLKSQIKITQNIIVNEQVRPLLSLAPYDLQKSANIIKEKERKCKSLSVLCDYIPGIKEAGFTKDTIDVQQKRINVPFLLQCQQFIEQAFNKAILLNDFLEFDDQGNLLQTAQNIKKQNTEKQFYFLLYKMERKLRFGHYKYKDQFNVEFTNSMKQILSLDEPKLHPNEKDFLSRINQLKYDFMKNTLDKEKLKTKEISIPKMVRRDQRM